MLRYLLSAILKPTQVENGRQAAKQKDSFPPQQEGSPLNQCQGRRMPLLARPTLADGIYRPWCPAREVRQRRKKIQAGAFVFIQPIH